MKALLLLTLFLSSCTHISMNDLRPRLTAKSRGMKKKLDRAVCELESSQIKVEMLQTEFFITQLKEIEKRINQFEKLLPEILQNPESFQESPEEFFAEDLEALTEIIDQSGELALYGQSLFDKLSTISNHLQEPF